MTSYTVLPKEPMETNWSIPWLQGCGAAEQFLYRVAAGILYSFKAGCISYFSSSSYVLV